MNLPDGLDETYSQISAKIKKTSSHTFDLVRRILPGVIEARRPFTIAKLKEAVALDHRDDHADYLNGSSDPDGISLTTAYSILVVSEPDSGLVQVAHHIVSQFIEKSQGLLGRSNDFILQICLSVLSLFHGL